MQIIVGRLAWVPLEVTKQKTNKNTHTDTHNNKHTHKQEEPCRAFVIPHCEIFYSFTGLIEEKTFAKNKTKSVPDDSESFSSLHSIIAIIVNTHQWSCTSNEITDKDYCNI